MWVCKKTKNIILEVRPQGCLHGNSSGEVRQKNLTKSMIVQCFFVRWTPSGPVTQPFIFDRHPSLWRHQSPTWMAPLRGHCNFLRVKSTGTLPKIKARLIILDVATLQEFCVCEEGKKISDTTNCFSLIFDWTCVSSET